MLEELEHAYSSTGRVLVARQEVEEARKETSKERRQEVEQAHKEIEKERKEARKVVEQAHKETKEAQGLNNAYRSEIGYYKV